MTSLKPNQIENLLTELVELKDKLANTKATLKDYKIKSEKLTQLQQAKKQLNAQLEEEKKSIEDEFLADNDYETAANDELTHKNDIKEKNAELRQLMAQVNRDQDLSTYDYNIKGEPLKMQVERLVKVYINGREER